MSDSAHHPPSESLAPEGYEMQQRNPPSDAKNTSYGRSLSAPGSQNTVSRERNSPGPSTTAPSFDGSSQVTVAAPGVPKPVVESHIVGVPEANRSNSRINSDPSSNSTGGQAAEEFDERGAIVPKANLSILDVAALVLNKQIGTGIFSTPGLVLASTRSKELSIALWSIGGLWTILFLLVYLEFGNALPFNGGELVYLDEVFHKPELLTTILFSGFFLLLANSYGNSVQFAKHILLAALPNVDATTELDSRLIRYIAISVITVSCGIHWFFPRAGLFLNKFVACYKAILLIVVIGTGLNHSVNHESYWGENISRGSKSDGMAAMVFIFYSYQGWENANYVAGEIRARGRRTPKRILNFGALLGVGTVWVLYVLVTVTLYHVLPFEKLTGPNSDLVASLQFAPLVFGASTAFKICIALSAFGNVLAVTYTASKVKQSIAIQRILPFWRRLSRDENTPKGALFLHWITSMIYIAAAPVHSDGYSFAIGLHTYGHVIASTFVSIGLIWLQKRMSEPNEAKYPLTFFKNKYLLKAFSFTFAGANAVILGFAAKDRSSGKIARFWWPVTIAALLTVSFIYWAGIYLTTVKIRRRGELVDIGDIIGFKVVVYHNDNMAPDDIKKDIAEKLQSQIDGSSRRVKVETSGWVEAMVKRVKRVKEFWP
ncbi:hypothetical protein IQ07DRAFT_643463 [Pyrenochaeta sp. DS3sAY3a]|nr:hypothetical protein IQ07DRAFT_643463 [Pyrenochaeta sp. DS3sAY3a]